MLPFSTDVGTSSCIQDRVSGYWGRLVARMGFGNATVRSSLSLKQRLARRSQMFQWNRRRMALTLADITLPLLPNSPQGSSSIFLSFSLRPRSLKISPMHFSTSRPTVDAQKLLRHICEIDTRFGTHRRVHDRGAIIECVSACALGY
jgi:hypothetical protein